MLNVASWPLFPTMTLIRLSLVMFCRIETESGDCGEEEIRVEAAVGLLRPPDRSDRAQTLQPHASSQRCHSEYEKQQLMVVQHNAVTLSRFLPLLS